MCVDIFQPTYSGIFAVCAHANTDSFIYTLRLICSTARMKLAPVPILYVLGLPTYMVQARIKWVRMAISFVLCYKLSVV